MLEGDNCCRWNKVEVRGGKMEHRILILKWCFQGEPHWEDDIGPKWNEGQSHFETRAKAFRQRRPTLAKALGWGSAADVSAELEQLSGTLAAAQNALGKE